MSATVQQARVVDYWRQTGRRGLPFAHSESLADQELSMRLNARLESTWQAHAEGHRDIVRRCGRFPHRNPMLGRDRTPQEEGFLRRGGFAG